MGRRLVLTRRSALLLLAAIALAAAGLLLAAACIGRFAPASPTLTPTPTAPAGGSASRPLSATPMTAADFPTPPDRDLMALARQFRGVDNRSESASYRFANQELRVGHRAEFWIADLAAQQVERAPFRLGHISPRAYWWVEDGLDITDADLAQAAAIAEPQVLAPVYAAFAPADSIPDGSDRADGPPRLHIVHDHLRGVGGYASASDAYPAAVAPYSNEINAVYINTQQTSLFDDAYLTTLAHELQHAIHNQADATEEGWLNEGLAELAVAEAGLRAHSIAAYLERPRVSLVNWPAVIGNDTGVHYGAAALFAHYLREHYVGGDGLIRLLGEAADGIAGVNAYLDKSGVRAVAGSPDPLTFRNVFADWMVANLLDQPDSSHGYAGLSVRADHRRSIRPGDDPRPAELDQYGVDYILVRRVDGDAVIGFSGAAATHLLPTAIPDGSCWWSNRGDNIATTLTAQVSVPAAGPDGAAPALSFRHWHLIENEWDYAYIAASVDDGATWRALPATGTTDADPVGNSYGPGYTGASAGWELATADLSDYAGQEILLRFQYVTDEAIHAPGFCVRELALSSAGNAAAVPIPVGDWAADGFVRVNNRVFQEWLVWVIVEGERPALAWMDLQHDLDADVWRGTVEIAAGAGDTVTVAIAPLAPATKEAASYEVWVANQ